MLCARSRICRTWSQSRMPISRRWTLYSVVFLMEQLRCVLDSVSFANRWSSLVVVGCDCILRCSFGFYQATFLRTM